MNNETVTPKLLICILLSLTTFAVFYQVIHFDFVNYDDPGYITDNFYVRRGITLENFIWAFSTFAKGNWHPLTWLSHMADVQIFGLNPSGHHMVNLVLHIFNTVILFLFLGRTTGALWQSSLVAALFALHPLHVESVAWVSERKDVLSTFFWFLTLMLYQWHLRRPGLFRYLLSLICYAVGLMAKPMLVTVPFVLLLIDYWPLGRLSFFSAKTAINYYESNSLQHRSFLSLFIEKVPFFILSSISCVITFLAQKQVGAVGSIQSIPFLFRIGNALLAYAAYLAKMIWPFHLAVLYLLPPRITALQVLGAFFILLAISVLVVRKSQRYPYLLFGWLWYLGTLVPVTGLVQVGLQSMADRYTYVPLVGPFVMIVWGVSSLIEKRPYRKAILLTVAVLLLPALAICTRKQLGHWQNSILLFKQAVKVDSNNHVAHKNLALSLGKVGRFAEAYDHAQKALRLVPEDSDALNVMGYLYALEGRTFKAALNFEKAIKVDASNAAAHFNLGNALVKLGKPEKAIQHYKEALRIKPDWIEAIVNLADALIQSGRSDEAIRHLSKVVQRFPESLEARHTLAVALAEAGRIDEAIVHFSYLVKRYNMPEALYGLGIASIKRGKIDKAIEYFSRALELRPDVPEFRRSYEAALRLKGQASGE